MAQNKQKHIPVLLSEVMQTLHPGVGDTYLDLTSGYGGHASQILDVTKTYKQSVLVDRDAEAVEVLEDIFGGTGAQIVKDDFLNACRSLLSKKRQFDMVLVDLGVSSPHLDKASRGFSFVQDGPLDMRMDTSASISAEDIINTYPEEEIADIIFQYGEEPKSRAIARAIVQSRPISTTKQLADIIASCYSWSNKSRRHPATKTFQALRIAVNDELRQISEALPIILELLNEDGKLGVISFHSLEDRIVKDFFNEYAGQRYDAILKLVTKKPIVAGQEEIAINPRSRSAKLRVAVKIKTKKKGKR